MPYSNSRPEILIASMGGVGTTFLMDFISLYKVVNNNYGDNHLKHAAAPPAIPTIKCALYLIGDPRVTVVSLFLRGYHHWHERNMSGAMTLHAETTLNEYLATGIDKFQFKRQLHNWLHERTDYPVMI